jgi:hypothetical protein
MASNLCSMDGSLCGAVAWMNVVLPLPWPLRDTICSDSKSAAVTAPHVAVGSK